MSESLTFRSMTEHDWAAVERIYRAGITTGQARSRMGTVPVDHTTLVNLYGEADDGFRIAFVCTAHGMHAIVDPFEDGS